MTRPAENRAHDDELEKLAKPSRPGRGRGVAVGVAVLVVLLILVFAGNRYLFSRHHISTDNAQVDGHITPVLSRVGGYVMDVRATENMRVRAGDTLVVLDDRDLQVQLQRAEAELAAALAAGGEEAQQSQAQAQQSAALAAARAADAAVQQARVAAGRAHRDLERVRPLAEQNIISSQQFDAAQSAAETADAQVVAAEQNARAAREQVASASAGVTSADARVAAARAMRDQAELQLSYTRIVAPVDGIVARESVTAGQLVSPGQPLMSVVPVSESWVVANIKETDIDRLALGNPVEISIDAYPGHPFHGEVESISPATGSRFSLLPPDNATGNFTKVVQRVPVRIRVTDGESETTPLRPGLSAEVEVTTE